MINKRKHILLCLLVVIVITLFYHDHLSNNSRSSLVQATLTHVRHGRSLPPRSSSSATTTATTTDNGQQRLEFPSQFSTSFNIRDRTNRNKLVMHGVMNVHDIRFFNETEAIFYMYDDMDSEENKVLHLYHGEMAMKNMNNGRALSQNGHERAYLKLREYPEQDFHCIRDPNDIPPLELVFDSLRNMGHMDPKLANQVFDREVKQCITQGLSVHTVKFAEQTYVLCVSFVPHHSDEKSTVDRHHSSSSVPVRLIGREFVVDFESFSERRIIGWLVEQTRSTIDRVCANVRKERVIRQSMNRALSSTASKKKSLQQHNDDESSWFQSYEHSCRYPWIKDQLSCQTHEETNKSLLMSKNKQGKVCIFLHGAGNDASEAGEPVHSYPEYWGRVEQYTPQCSERWFIREDTKEKGWDDKGLQESYCKLALIYQKPGDTVIRDKIIFAHSMANVILADAIQNGICSIDVNTTSWYETQGSLLGSKAAHTIRNICRHIHDGNWPSDLNPLLMKWVITKAGYCIPGTNHSYPVYDTLDPSFEKLKGLSKIAKQYVKGALCGNSAFGLTTTYSLPLSLFSMYTSYDEDNDAIVPWTSCDKGNGDYSEHYSNLYYSARVNHADGTCRNGNGWWGATRRPCSWFTDKV